MIVNSIAKGSLLSFGFVIPGHQPHKNNKVIVLLKEEVAGVVYGLGTYIGHRLCEVRRVFLELKVEKPGAGMSTRILPDTRKRFFSGKKSGFLIPETHPVC
jgi:hypothetical protein